MEMPEEWEKSAVKDPDPGQLSAFLKKENGNFP